MPRVQRKFLIGSRWTAVVPLEHGDGLCHYEVVGLVKETVVLRPVLGGAQQERPIRELEDAARWISGWQPVSERGL